MKAAGVDFGPRAWAALLESQIAHVSVSHLIASACELRAVPLIGPCEEQVFALRPSVATGLGEVNVKRVIAWLCAVGLSSGAMSACSSSGSGTGGNGSIPVAGIAGTSVGAGSLGANSTSTAGASTAAGASATGAGGEPGIRGSAGSGTGGNGASTTGTAGQAGMQAGTSGQGATGAAGQAAPIGKCGTRSGMRGKTSRTVKVGSDNRTFIAYLPQAADATLPLPFVYVFHGANQTGQILYDMTEYAKLADTEKIAVVFADGQGVSSATGTSSLAPWDVTDGDPLCGLGTLVSNPNPIDFPFMDAIKTEIENDQCLDDQHVFSTGFSMGGYFTHHVACNRPGIRAAAPHSGGTLADLGSCTNQHMPIIVFHGTADSLIDDACDDPKASAQPGFAASSTLWAMKNGCKATYTTTPADGPSGKGQCYLYDGCPADGQVEACIFTDLPHAWAGAPVCESCIGDGIGWASATQLQWAFFKKYAW